MRTLLLFFLIAFVHAISAQDLKLCTSDNGLTGYCNESGDVVIEQKYWDGLPFMDGHAAVRVEDLWGIINSSGRWMVEPRYEEVFNCENVLSTILVKEEGKWHFSNEYGIDLSHSYEVASPWYVFELDGYTARFSEKSWFSVIRKGKWGIIDINDELKLPFEYEFSRVLKESVNGVEKPVSIILKKKGKYAWQRLDGQAATGFEFDSFLGQYIELLFFQTGSSPTIINSTTGERLSAGSRDFYSLVDTEDSVGLVNSTGKIIIPFKYQQVNMNKVENHIVYGKYGQVGLSDLDGIELLPPIYQDVNGLGTDPEIVVVKNQEDKLALFRIDGEKPHQVTPFKYSSVTYNGSEIQVIAGNRPGIVSVSGEESWQ